jgi:hypothetical protein
MGTGRCGIPNNSSSRGNCHEEVSCSGYRDRCCSLLAARRKKLLLLPPLLLWKPRPAAEALLLPPKPPLLPLTLLLLPPLTLLLTPPLALLLTPLSKLLALLWTLPRRCCRQVIRASPTQALA